MSAPIPTQAPREDYDDFPQRYVEASSLGSPEARALRKSVSDETAQRVVERSRQIEDDFPCCAPDKAALARIKHAIMSRIEAEQKARCTVTWSKTGAGCVCGWTTYGTGDIVGRVLEHLGAR